MTIIKPKKKKYRSNKVLLVGIAVVLSQVILGVFFYNANVDLRYMEEGIGTDIARIEAQNAELRDKLYRVLDFDDIDKFTASLGLVKDNSPEYLLALMEKGR
jgi:flagellar basal body-associated protein FliL